MGLPDTDKQSLKASFAGHSGETDSEAEQDN
jgi:hypothetical protein